METRQLVSSVYHVRVLGYIWQPGYGECAQDYEIRARDKMEYPRSEGETDLEYEIRMVQCVVNTGDFQEITAWEIERADTFQTIYSETVRKTETDWVMILAFDDDARMRWEDCMFGGEE